MLLPFCLGIITTKVLTLTSVPCITHGSVSVRKLLLLAGALGRAIRALIYFVFFNDFMGVIRYKLSVAEVGRTDAEAYFSCESVDLASLGRSATVGDLKRQILGAIGE
jgi:hypothetical protein